MDVGGGGGVIGGLEMSAGGNIMVVVICFILSENVLPIGGTLRVDIWVKIGTRIVYKFHLNPHFDS